MITVAVIADIHFGAISANKLYDELRSQFLDFIKDRYIDMVVIAGDFYNSLLTLNSPSVNNSFRFMQELVYIAKSNGIKYIRIIEGTLSHDNFQILNFKPLEKDEDIDFRVIEKSISESIEDMNILYLPEEYGKSIKEYSSLLNVPKKYYDMIFGHGMFKETSFENVTDEENKISTSVIWDSKLLCSVCKGPIVFGHIHTTQIIRKNIFYCGSFSRWNFGQEEDKGFYIFIYDNESHKYLYDFIKNKLAPRYDTLTIYLDKFTGDAKDIIKLGQDALEDYLRIQLILENPNSDNMFILNFLKEYYTGKSAYKFQVIDKRSIQLQEEAKEELAKTNIEYEYIFDKSVSMKTKISKYIKKKYQEDVSEDIIKDLLDLS